jgi:hypothetical protein
LQDQYSAVTVATVRSKPVYSFPSRRFDEVVQTPEDTPPQSRSRHPHAGKRGRTAPIVIDEPHCGVQIFPSWEELREHVHILDIGQFCPALHQQP